MNKVKKAKGFSTLEIMISLFVFSLTISSVVLISFGNQSSVIKSKIFQDIFFKSQLNLEKAKAQGVGDWDKLISFNYNDSSFEEKQIVSLLYDYSKKIKESVRQISEKNLNSAELFTLISDWQKSVGGDTCFRNIDNLEKFSVISSFNLGTNSATDINVVRGLAYISVNSSNKSDDDLFILDVKDSENVSLVSSLNTGPGLNSIHVVGRYIFVANDSTIKQLQVIDVSEIQNPVLVSDYRLFGNASTTIANSIFYKDQKIYLGTEKHNIGNEFHVLSFSTNDLLFRELGSFEVSTRVNDVVIQDGHVFLAVPNPYPLRVLDLSDLQNIQEVYSFYTGGITQHGGQSLSVLNNFLVMGRSVLSVSDTYHELFLFDISNPRETGLLDSVNIKGSVRSVLLKTDNLIVGNLKPGKEFQVWNISEEGKFGSKKVLSDFDWRPVAIDCDSETLYVITEDLNNSLIILGKK